jgi:hypothetical protein
MMLFLIFLRFLPVIAIAEIKGVLPESDPHYDPSFAKRDNLVAAPSYEGDRLENRPAEPTAVVTNAAPA